MFKKLEQFLSSISFLEHINVDERERVETNLSPLNKDQEKLALIFQTESQQQQEIPSAN